MWIKDVYYNNYTARKVRKRDGEEGERRIG